MKYVLFIAIVILLIVTSCDTRTSEEGSLLEYKESFKEQPGNHFNEYLDSTTNIYSNFKYHVAFDAPDTWKADAGLSEHTIFRAYQPDSNLVFSINVIELQTSKSLSAKAPDIWEMYQSNKNQMDHAFITLIEKQFKTIVTNHIASKSYIRGNGAIKRSLSYDERHLDYEYNMTSISYQTFVNNLTFTFTFNIPTLYFDMNQNYYESMFLNVSFLKDTETLDGLLNKK
jgi:hypothetical protein